MNALEHAQPASGASLISVRLAPHSSGQVRLVESDNGAAPEQSSNEVSGLGTQLIRMLARQPNGMVGIERAAGNYAVLVTFPPHSVVSWRPPS